MSIDEQWTSIDAPPDLLRRADWRFLSPNPPGNAFQHLVLLDGPPSLAGQILALGLAEQVSTALPHSRTADAIAALHGAHISPASLADALLPGGWLYLEVSRQSVSSLSMSPARIRRLLQDAGLTTVGTYVVWPHFDGVQLYLPVAAPGAFDWYFKSIYRATTPAQRLFEAGLRGMAQLGADRVAQLAPHFAVTAVAGDVESTAPSVLADSALPVPLRGQTLFPILLTDGGDRVTILPFSTTDRRPCAVLKIPKLPSYNGRTENEHEVLTQIRSKLDESLRRTIPQPLGLLAHGNISVAVESYLPGQSLDRTCRRWGVPLRKKVIGLRRATAWLVRFHTRTQAARPPWGSNERSVWVDEPFEAYGNTFGLTDDERRLFALTRRHCDHLTGRPFPIVWQHRDFNVWNIVHDKSAVKVIDWEGCRPGPALCDLLHFVSHWHDAVRGTRNREDRLKAYQRLFCQRGPVDRATTAAHRAIADYMRRLDLDHQFLPLLLVYTWVELALRNYQQLHDRRDLPPDIRAGIRAVAFVELLGNHAEAVFYIDPHRESMPVQ
jgi:hypothetical protein